MQITITVKPNSRQESVVSTGPDEYRVAVNAAAQDGKANDAVIRVLAEHFGVPKSRVRITHGQKGKKKRVEVEI